VAKVKLYIDEDLTDRLAVALRSRKFDVINPGVAVELAKMPENLWRRTLIRKNIIRN
jgi:hypothetical protein